MEPYAAEDIASEVWLESLARLLPDRPEWPAGSVRPEGVDPSSPQESAGSSR